MRLIKVPYPDGRELVFPAQRLVVLLLHPIDRSEEGVNLPPNGRLEIIIQGLADAAFVDGTYEELSHLKASIEEAVSSVVVKPPTPEKPA